MPKIAVDKNGDPGTREDQVRAAGQVGSVHAEAKAETPDGPAEEQFGLATLATVPLFGARRCRRRCCEA